MFSSSTFLLFSVANLWVRLSVAVSARSCVDRPVFTPPLLVVRFGDPASAVCSVCQKDCLVSDTIRGLEHAVGTSEEIGTNIFWNIDSFREWDPRLICFYRTRNGLPCQTGLNVTLYQPPKSVSIRFDRGDGLLLEGQSYTVECGVQQVAPVKSLKVTFYRGQEPLADRFSTSEKKKPVDEVFSFSFKATEEDDGAEYWCDAQLDLKVQQVPPAASSQRLSASANYKPRVTSRSSPDITITEKDPLELNCSAVGKPSPSYTWTHPNNVRSLSSSVYRIESVSLGDAGVYTCTVSNSMGTATVNFNVEVKDDYIEIIIAAVIIAVVLLIIAVVIYKNYYNHNYTGSYDLMRDMTCCGCHTAVPTSALPAGTHADCLQGDANTTK